MLYILAYYDFWIVKLNVSNKNLIKILLSKFKKIRLRRDKVSTTLPTNSIKKMIR